MSRLFSRSNSSIFLQSGTALQAKVLRLRDEMFLVDAGIGTSRICTQDELIGDPNTKWPTRFENRVGYLDRVSGETPVKKQILERCFVDMVTGDSAMKERAAIRFNDIVGWKLGRVAMLGCGGRDWIMVYWVGCMSSGRGVY